MAVNEEARSELIAKLLDEHGLGSESIRVSLKGKQEFLPVIRININSTVLNSTSHRIRSQLESIPEAQAALDQNSDSDVSQDFIRKLLRATPGFEELKQNLSDEGQKAPGIITREGRLINANTRAVALGDLGVEYIDAAVLPAATTIAEILDLELDLQVAQDFRQNYSFTNELLFVDDLVSGSGLDENAVAIRLRWTTPTKATTSRTGPEKVQRYIRHLALIREIQGMSDGAIPLTDFDDAAQALAEYDKTYESIRVGSPEKAERLKTARTLGLLVDLGYERLRTVDSDWVENYFSEAIVESDLLAEVWEGFQIIGLAADANQDDLGLGVFGGASSTLGADEGESARIHSFVADLASSFSRAAGKDLVPLNMPEGERLVEREILRTTINEAMRSASDDAKAAAKAGDALELPSHLVKEAARSLQKAAKKYREIRKRESFDKQSFEAAVAEAERAMDALHITLKE